MVSKETQARTVELLRSFEWEDGDESYCSFCLNAPPPGYPGEKVGHDRDCEMGVVLAGLGASVQWFDECEQPPTPEPTEHSKALARQMARTIETMTGLSFISELNTKPTTRSRIVHFDRTVRWPWPSLEGR